MSETLLAVLGFATIIMIIALLLKNVTVPALAFISVSAVTAAILVAAGTYSISEIGEFIESGVSGTSPTPGVKEKRRTVCKHRPPCIKIGGHRLTGGRLGS